MILRVGRTPISTVNSRGGARLAACSMHRLDMMRRASEPRKGTPPPLEGHEGSFTLHRSRFVTHGGIATSQAMAVERTDVQVLGWDEDGSVEEYFGQLRIIPSPSSHPARVLARGHHLHLV
jgi:hypothetical protein